MRKCYNNQLRYKECKKLQREDICTWKQKMEHEGKGTKELINGHYEIWKCNFFFYILMLYLLTFFQFKLSFLKHKLCLFLFSKLNFTNFSNMIWWLPWKMHIKFKLTKLTFYIFIKIQTNKTYFLYLYPKPHLIKGK